MDYQTQQILLQELVVLREGITKTLETLSMSFIRIAESNERIADALETVLSQGDNDEKKADHTKA